MTDATLDLSRRQSAFRHWLRVLIRAGRDSVEDDLPMLASALAFNAFLAIPAVLLLVVGLFSLVTDPSLIADLMQRFGTVIPGEAVTLLENSLLQLEQQPSSGIAMTVVGFLLALWTTTGAVTTLMVAVNRAHDLDDSRGFAKKRLVAVVVAAVLGTAVLLVGALLVLGPHVHGWIGRALDAEDPVAWIWWTTEWPILLAVLFGAFSVVYALAFDHSNRRWRLISPGAAVAVVLWLAVSGAFAFYAANFGSYDKTYGALGGVVVFLLWLWLTNLAILLGAEFNAETERARQLHDGTKGAEKAIQLEPRAAPNGTKQPAGR
jgi:membrane protein